MRNTLLLFALIFVLGCAKKKKDIPNEMAESNKEVLTKKEDPALELIKDKLHGQFIFDLIKKDKNLNPNSRAYMTKKAVISGLKKSFKFTFYGNGKGVMFLDDGSYDYITQKELDSNKILYKIKDEFLFIKSPHEKDYTKFAKIVDESIKKDYFILRMVNFKGANFNVALYKVGDAPKSPF